jgi:hypothetical protein
MFDGNIFFAPELSFFECVYVGLSVQTYKQSTSKQTEQSLEVQRMRQELEHLKVYSYNQVTEELCQARKDGYKTAAVGGFGMLVGAPLVIAAAPIAAAVGVAAPVAAAVGVGMVAVGAIAECGGLLNSWQATKLNGQRRLP